jgi:hypothetical protein
MACNSCGSVHQKRYDAEIDIHFPGMRNLKKSPVLVFPEILMVCLDCGKGEFTVPKDELVQLAKDDVTEGS